MNIENLQPKTTVYHRWFPKTHFGEILESNDSVVVVRWQKIPGMAVYTLSNAQEYLMSGNHEAQSKEVEGK